MLLNFQLGEDCPCPEEIRDELYEFHDDLLIHCGEWQIFVFYLRNMAGFYSDFFSYGKQNTDVNNFGLDVTYICYLCLEARDRYYT